MKELEREDRKHKLSMEEQLQKDKFEKKIRQLGEAAGDFHDEYEDSFAGQAGRGGMDGVALRSERARSDSDSDRGSNKSRKSGLRDFSESDSDSMDD